MDAPLSGQSAQVSRLGELIGASRSQGVAWMLAGIWLMSAFDIFLTLTAHHLGVLQETNPIAEYLLPHGVLPILLYKLSLVTFSSTILWHLRGRLLAELAIGGVFIIYVIVAVHWHVCIEMYALIQNSNMSQLAMNTVGA